MDASLEQVKKDKARDYHLRKTYGISLEDYALMLKKQNFKCAMCGKPASECAKSLHVDHNHAKLKKGEKFKKVRGLLCFHCNRELVRRHSIKTARLLLNYLLLYDSEVQPDVNVAVLEEPPNTTSKS